MRSPTAARAVAAAAALSALAALAELRPFALGGSAAWVGGPRPSRAGARRAARRALSTERSEAFLKCVEYYDPNDPSNEPFSEGPPPTGFRDLTQCISPYHPNPEWQIWPEPPGHFERDQKVASMYTLASGMFKDINKALREDNEDAMRRLAPMIWEIRHILKFQRDKICTPEGRKCKPFMGQLVRGLDLPQDQVEAVANEYKVGMEFSWPAFTSCQMDEGDQGGLWPFEGNLHFEIACNIDPRTMDAEEIFAPVRIGRFLGGSTEVLLPPHTKFKVVGEREVERVRENDLPPFDVYTKILEVVELPTPMKKPR
ncbi:unnamed protein product [Prorocentrum cordatum]|uniref:NAD(P)(+)--arginine ADP-ribosyltransferase n=1 Tax=Prorocentrum cordatum TaxID=2364126 RepID=A0ABN9QY30_9DINO|nr:unnamed protein product [Polarella glacialis]|mmetsp:Transcript_65368/g.170112  ORF Transcript_65368/g.170112 Transcript_65368/m.170112 type:complete len:314 (+) Transcript_65368:87-1028(+)